MGAGRPCALGLGGRSGTTEQKEKYLPRIASGELRIQSMGVTEPTTGSDTTKLKTMAVKKDGRWVINGQKVWISRIQHSELMILLARTTPLADVVKKSEGMSIFIVVIHLIVVLRAVMRSWYDRARQSC